MNSHIKALRELKGEKGLAKLREHCPEYLHFKNTDDVPVRKETELLECAVQLIHDGRVFSQEELEYEAGVLHFQNFLTTPLAKILFPLLRAQFKPVMMRAKHIAGHVFRNVEFDSEELGEHALKVFMKNNDYPLFHFKGFFQAWMDFSGRTGKVEARELADGVYEYTMKWE